MHMQYFLCNKGSQGFGPIRQFHGVLYMSQHQRCHSFRESFRMLLNVPFVHIHHIVLPHTQNTLSQSETRPDGLKSQCL